MIAILLTDLLIRQNNNTKTAIKYGTKEISFIEWYRRAKEMSKEVERLVSQESKSIAIFLPNSIDYAVAYYAVLFSNKIIIPIGIQSKANEIISTILYCEIELIITSKKYRGIFIENFEEFNNKTIVFYCEDYSFDILNKTKKFVEKTKYIEITNTKDDVAIMLHTSGTTNNPKRVMLTHDNLINNIRSNIKSLELSEADKTLISLPMVFGYCNCAQFLTNLYLGATSVILDNFFFPKYFFKIVQQERITTFTGVPSMLLMLLDYKYSHLYDFTSLKYICFGGGKMPIDKLKSLIVKYPSIGFVQTYGQTECSPRVTALLPADSIKKIGSVGKPIPGVEIKIIDKNNKNLLNNQQGEILVRGKNIMKGYYKQKDITNQIIQDGWIHTGDIGYLDDDGYLYLKGRIKNIIISGGINIYPEEIEQILMQNECVENAYVYGVDHDMMGEIPMAKVVLKAAISEEQLKKYCRQKLTNYKVPVKINFVTSLPQTYNGKIKRYKEN